MPSATLFWLVALVLVAATVVTLVWPLLRVRAARSPEDDGAATDIYRDQKRQLDQELAAGAITRPERDTQLDELATRLGAELAAEAPQVARTSTRSSFVAALIVVAVIPVGALLLYSAVGSPGSLRGAKLSSERPALSQEEIVAMVDKLATRMKQHPEDPTGWRLLARAYASMGRFSESIAAFNEAAARGPADASLLADWADALAMQNQSLQGEPSRLVARALALDPSHPKALSLAATGALERKDYDGAISQWRKLKAEVPVGSEEAKEIDTMVAQASAAASEAPVTPSFTTGGAASAASLPATSSSAQSASSDASAGPRAAASLNAAIDSLKRPIEA
ncbi:MAG: c-type cytochrome biogenesis protein CcmI [Burkholderiales bacterium]